MPNYESDETLQEIHDEMYREEEQAQPKGLAAMSDKSRFYVAIFAGALLLSIFLEWITPTQGLIVGGIAFAVLFLMKSSGAERRELTWLECQIRIYDLLYFLQQHPIGPHYQIPPGEIRVKPVGRKQWYEGKAFKRAFGVDIYNEVLDVTDQYYVEIDVFTGDLITFREAPEGVKGDETKDIKLIPSRDTMLQKKADEYGARR